ncbi:NmrA family NAD(P)-binding protein [Paramicrobacterium fandaimingii]|uniref:NmrA family NAD(P)-binding protein n=1 Tax=Paramicrobacterium fandaimingii TaxID=2708079 RepID=UPI0014225890|nr:NmrA family NAD(P)-binding protein [Microbacterium fandaimingii]
MILVTTAGKVGGATAAHLAERGEQVRLIVRDPSRHHKLAAVGIELVRGDLGDADTVRHAVHGISGIVLVTSPVRSQEMTVIDRARAEGVGHVTKITTEASADSPIARRRDHYAIEQHLEKSELPYTLLRANAYMQNFLMLAPGIAKASEFASPTGNGRIGMIDVRDVAAAAAAVAMAPSDGAGSVYRLSGPVALSYDDAASILTSVLHRPVRHRAITIEQQEAALVADGVPPSRAHANATALGLFAEGDSDWVTGEAEKLTGQASRTFEQFVTDHAERFRLPPHGIQKATQ